MEELFDRYINTRKLQASTIGLYKQKLAMLYRKIIGSQNIEVRMTKTLDLFKKLDSSMEWVFDVEAVHNAIKEESIGSQKTIYSILAPLLNFINTDKSNEFGEIYRKKIFEFGEIISNNTKKQTITKPKLKQSWVDWKDITQRYDEYVSNVGNGGLAIDNLDRNNTAFIALSFMVLFCPRRSSCIEKLKVVMKPVSDEDYLEMDNEFNYIYLTKNKGKTTLVLNNYKTSQRYGRQKFILSDRFTKLLNLYMTTRFIPKGHENDEMPFLIQKTLGNSPSHYPFTSAGISGIIKKFMTDEFKMPNITTTDLRTIYITSWYNESNRYITEVETESFKLGTSPSEFTKSYVKRKSEIS